MRKIVNEDKYTVHYVGGVPQEDRDHPDALNNYAVISYRGVSRMTFVPSNIKPCGETLVKLVDQVCEGFGGIAVSPDNLSIVIDILIEEKDALGIIAYAGRHIPKP